MRRLVTSALVIGVVCGGAAAAQERKPGAAVNGDRAVLEADQAVGRAIRAADKTAAGALLDEQFTWIDRAGKSRTKAQVVQDLTTPASGTDGDTDVKARSYGQVGVVTGTHRISAQNVDVRFLRVWVKRPAGWRALVHQGNTILANVPPTQQGPAVGAGGDCENPCRSIPYKPKTAAEQEIIASYQALETAVATHDADAWAPHFADEFVVIGRDGHATAKPERIAAIKKQKEAGAPTNPGPLQSMQMWVFGNAAVMTSHHVTASASKTPYRVTRVWVKRDGRWQMAYSQQTTIQQPAGTTQ